MASSANNLAIAGTGMLLRDFYASSFAYIETEAMLSDAEDALALLAGSGILDHRSLEELGQQLEAIASILEARNSAMTGLEAYDIPIGFSRTSLEVPVSGFPAVTGFSYAGGPCVMGTKVESRYPQINRMESRLRYHRSRSPRWRHQNTSGRGSSRRIRIGRKRISIGLSRRDGGRSLSRGFVPHSHGSI